MEAAGVSSAGAEEVGGPQARRPLPWPSPAAGRGAARRADRLAGDRLSRLARWSSWSTAFWEVDALSGEVEQNFSLDNFQTIVDEPVYRTIAGRTILIAALVTITDALLAFPIAFYMAKVASSRMKAVLVVAVLLPLWSSYLVKVYAWRTILSSGGILNWRSSRSGSTARATATSPSGWS